MRNQATIGKTGLTAFKMGFGAGVVGNEMMYPKMDDEKSRQLLEAVLDGQFEMIDTAYIYGQGKSEE